MTSDRSIVRAYSGIFLTALATIVFELLLTRLLSVTLWYHFAFAVIAIAMFGLSAGGTVVFLKPRYFVEEFLDRWIAFACALSALLMVISVAWHLNVPIVSNPLSMFSFVNILITFLLFGLPFVFSGIAICAMLTRSSYKVGALYGFDLAGSAFGCVIFVALLSVIDGPSAVCLTATLMVLASAAFVSSATLARLYLCLVLVLALLGGGNALLHDRGLAPLRIRTIKNGAFEGPLLYETWNAFSRIAVSKYNPLVIDGKPFGWGMSAKFKSEQKIAQLWLTIDGSAGTPLTEYKRNNAPLEYLRHDVTNIVHFLRRDAKVLILGPGGGRDILAALLFQQSSVVGVEINQRIIDTLLRTFGTFTGYLDELPNVSFIVDEARS